LFFTAGNKDKSLGFNPEFGLFFTNILIAAGVTGTIWGLFSTHVA
jgi:hypothetical protein